MTAAILPLDRGLEKAELWAFLVFAAVLVVFAAGTGRRVGRARIQRRAAVAAWMLAGLIGIATYEGAAGQPELAAQLPYVASGALLALVIVIIGSALIVAAAVDRSR